MLNKYVLLLRGINVGGKNPVKMKTLKEELSNIGYKNVISYINSGNLIFESSETNVQILESECKALIKKHFNLDIPVLVVSQKRYEEMIESTPSWWNQNKEDINYVIFIISSYTSKDVVDIMKEINEDFEMIEVMDDLIFWTGSREKFNKTRYSKISATKANNMVTIRNANTFYKLNDLLK